MPEKKNQAVLSLQNDLSSLVLQHRSSTYWRTIRNTFGLFEKHFSEANEPKKARKYISDRKVLGLFLRNEHQFIPWRLCFQAWLNLYINNTTRLNLLLKLSRSGNENISSINKRKLVPRMPVLPPKNSNVHGLYYLPDNVFINHVYKFRAILSSHLEKCHVMVSNVFKVRIKCRIVATKRK